MSGTNSGSTPMWADHRNYDIFDGTNPANGMSDDDVATRPLRTLALIECCAGTI